MKLKVAGRKETSVKMRCREYCEIFKNDYVVIQVRSAASDTLGYPYVGTSFAKSALKKCNFLLYLVPYQTSMMKLLAVCIFAEMLHQRYLASFKIWFCSLVFKYFSAFFVWIL